RPFPKRRPPSLFSISSLSSSGSTINSREWRREGGGGASRTPQIGPPTGHAPGRGNPSAAGVSGDELGARDRGVRSTVTGGGGDDDGALRRTESAGSSAGG
ncbi:unnamed protein product, partial [Scytosiphon promiscuus]